MLYYFPDMHIIFSLFIFIYIYIYTYIYIYVCIYIYIYIYIYIHQAAELDVQYLVSQCAHPKPAEWGPDPPCLPLPPPMHTTLYNRKGFSNIAPEETCNLKVKICHFKSYRLTINLHEFMFNFVLIVVLFIFIYRFSIFEDQPDTARTKTKMT